jgi:hypothetical protein
MCSPLKESHGFNKYIKILRVKMTKKSPEDQQESGRPTRVWKTNKSPEAQQESGRLPRARTRNRETRRNLQESGCLQESRKTAKSQESRHPRVWRTVTI